MICITNRCGQNSGRCPTPLTCSGATAETESAIHAARLATAMNAPVAPVVREPIDFAGAEPEEFTQSEIFRWVDLARVLVLVAIVGPLMVWLATVIHNWSRS